MLILPREMDSPPAFRSQRQFCVDQMLPDEDPPPKNSGKFKKNGEGLKLGERHIARVASLKKNF